MEKVRLQSHRYESEKSKQVNKRIYLLGNMIKKGKAFISLYV